HALEMTLLAQNASSAWRLLDGSARGATPPAGARADVESCLQHLTSIGLEPDQQVLLEPIRDAFYVYAGTRERAESLLASGSDQQARQLLVGELAEAYDSVARLCKSLALANDRDIEEAIAARHSQARRVALLFGAVIAFLTLAGGFFCWLFLGGVLNPL